MDAKEFQQDYVVQGSEKTASGKAFDEDAQRVMTRFWPMSFSKQNRREAWQGVERLYYCNDWQWILDGDDFAQTIRFPTLRNAVMALTDKYMEDLPEAILHPHYDEDKELIKGKKAYVDYIQRQPHYKKVRRMALQDMFMTGDGFIRVGYFDIRKKFGDEKKEQTLYRDVGISYINYRDFFVDELAKTIHDPQRELCARDIIIRTQMPYSRFKTEVAPRYGFDVDGVMAEPFLQTLGVDYVVTNQRETLEQSQSNYVKLYEYENIETDEYIVVANGHTIFKGSLHECRGTKGFDVVNYKFEPRNDSFWSNCLAELMAAAIQAKDQIFNLELMNLKLTLQPVLAVSGDFGFNPRVHVLQPGGVWTAGSKMQGKVGDNISPVIAGNSQTRSYEMLTFLQNEMTTISRSNVQNLDSSTGQTATHDMQVDQSQNAHNARVSDINEIEAETALVQCILEVMHEFMVEDTDAKTPKRKIPIRGYRVRQGEEGDSVFFPKNGHEDLFYITNKMIDVNCRVEVLDKRSEKVAQVEKMGRIMQFIPMALNAAQVDPTIGKTVNFLGLIEQAADALGLEHSKTFNDDESIYDDEYQMLKEEIMLGNTVVLPTTETRKESMARMKYLLSFEKEMRDDFSKKQQFAFDNVMSQVTENILRNHLNDKYQQQQQTGVSPDQQQVPGQNIMPGGQLPAQGNSGGMSTQPSPTTSQALGGSIGGQMGPKTMPQPDPSVLNPSGRELA